jgi:hypothetical protein
MGAAVALPWLDAMWQPAARAAAGAARAPLRMAFFYVPNGAHMQTWTPAAEGSEFELPYTLEPLAKVRRQVLVLSGLAQTKARANGDGPGDHARSLASFLTGCQARKTHGADIRVGVSVDQVAAQRLMEATRFPSLEIGCDQGPQAGNCDSGYSCAYSANISWRTESTPNAKEIDPKLFFDRLFGGGTAAEIDQNRAKRDRYRRSILDFVREDAASLRATLGSGDQRKLDEYFSAVREIERRVEQFARRDAAPPPVPSLARPTGIPQDYAEHLKLMGDLLILAFQADLTRVATYVFANEGSNRSYSFIGVPDGHHDLSHHGGDAKKQEKIRDINRFHMTQFAYLLEKMQGIQDGERTLLDNSMIVYGSGIGDGNAHNHDNLPILLAGRGGGAFRSGRHVKYAFETPLNNLYLTMLDRLDCRVEKLGDSTGPLDGLS